MKKAVLVFMLLTSMLFSSCQRKKKEQPPEVKKPIASFSGSVIDSEGKPVSGFSVTINGKEVKASENGFSASVDSTGKYIVNIRKPGYGLVSKVFYEPVRDRKFRLTQGTSKTFNPGQAILLKDVNAKNCYGAEFKNVKLASDKFNAVPRVLDAQGNLVDFGFSSAPVKQAFDAFTAAAVCNPGATVSIPAGSLVGPNNQPPAGNVIVSITTVDLYSEDGMPGDYSFINRAEKTEGYMRSIGAAMVTIYSEDEKVSYQLDGKAKARLSIPIDRLKKNLKTFAPRIPLLSYNENTGIWEDEGYATFNKKEMAYEAEVGHFSEYNMDVEKTTPGCLKFRQPSTFDNTYKVASINYSDVVWFSTNTMGVVTEPGTCDVMGSKGLHMLYNLPSKNSAVPLNFDQICVLFYDAATATDPKGIYLINLPDVNQYSTLPNCTMPSKYDACYSIDASAFGEPLLLAGKKLVGGQILLQWIYNGDPSAYQYEIWRTDAAGAELSKVSFLCGAANATACTMSAGDNPKQPSAEKKKTIGLTSEDGTTIGFIKIKYVGGAIGISAASPVRSNVVTIN